MKKNKQRGQIKREKSTERRKCTEGEKEIEGEGGIQASLIQFVLLCMFYMINPVFSGPNKDCSSGID